MAARFGSGGARGRRVIGDDAPLYEPAPVTVEKIDVDRALALSRSLGSRGKHDAQRRAYQVASRANRRMAGEQQRHLQTRTLQDMESSERQGLGRAGRRRGVTASNLNHAIFARSDTGRSGRSNPWPKYGVGKGLVPMSALKAGAKTVDSALASATPRLKAGAKATVATPKRALATGLAGGAAIGSAGRPAQAQPIYVAPYSQGFGKAYRRYDPERNRQRRAGAAEATLAIGGGYSAHRGVRGIQRDTKELREDKVRRGVGPGKKIGGGVIEQSVGSKYGRKAIAVSRRNGLLLGGGIAGIAAAGGVGHWHNSNRGRTYR